MLCIVYASDARQNQDLHATQSAIDAILSIARKKNSQTTVTSALVYRGGKYLQLIEGNPQDVDELYTLICADNRHEKIEKLIDIPIKERTFPGSDLKLMLNLQEDTRFINFIAQNKEIFQSSDADVAVKLAHFGCAEFSELTPFDCIYDSDFFADKTFKLKKAIDIDWLEAEMMEPEKAIAGMHLSDILVQNSYHYKQLFELSKLHSEQQLTDILNTMYATGNLLVSNKPDAPVENQSTHSNNNKNNKRSFGQKLLKWLVIH